MKPSGQPPQIGTGFRCKGCGARFDFGDDRDRHQDDCYMLKRDPTPEPERQCIWCRVPNNYQCPIHGERQREPSPEACVQPRAPIVPCALCTAPVHTCEREDGPDYRCPAHPDGVQMRDGAWICSSDCGDKYIELWGEWEPPAEKGPA